MHHSEFQDLFSNWEMDKVMSSFWQDPYMLWGEVFP